MDPFNTDASMSVSFSAAPMAAPTAPNRRERRQAKTAKREAFAKAKTAAAEATGAADASATDAAAKATDAATAPTSSSMKVALAAPALESASAATKATAPISAAALKFDRAVAAAAAAKEAANAKQAASAAAAADVKKTIAKMSAKVALQKAADAEKARIAEEAAAAAAAAKAKEERIEKRKQIENAKVRPTEHGANNTKVSVRQAPPASMDLQKQAQARLFGTASGTVKTGAHIGTAPTSQSTSAAKKKSAALAAKKEKVKPAAGAGKTKSELKMEKKKEMERRQAEVHAVVKKHAAELDAAPELDDDAKLSALEAAAAAVMSSTAPAAPAAPAPKKSAQKRQREEPKKKAAAPRRRATLDTDSDDDVDEAEENEEEERTVDITSLPTAASNKDDENDDDQDDDDEDEDEDEEDSDEEFDDEDAAAPAASAALGQEAGASSSDDDDDDDAVVAASSDDSDDEAAGLVEGGQGEEVAVIEETPLVADLCHRKLTRALEQMNIERLTRVQHLAWPPMVAPGDVLVRSETGSGKTLAYGLPMVQSLLVSSETVKIDRSSGTLAIVMAPTRELTEQCATVLQQLCRYCAFIVVGSVHGGDDKHKEKSRLRKGIHILVATPGRLLDHLQTTTAFKYDSLHTIVMDEADRLLDMGFERTIESTMSYLGAPTKRVLVSATITDAVKRLSHFALREPVTVGETEDVFDVPASLRQHYLVVPCRHRLVALASVLLSQLSAGNQKIVVFMSTADATEFHYLLFSRLQHPWRPQAQRQRPQMSATRRGSMSTKKMMAQGPTDGPLDDDDENNQTVAPPLEQDDTLFTCPLFKLHGNMGQVDRSSIFKSFKEADKGVLFCTDVAARGLDMPKISSIIHYDPPMDERCYIHRVGRTARIGNVGDSLIFVMPHEKGFIEYLQDFTKSPLNEKTLAVYLYHLSKVEIQAAGKKTGAEAKSSGWGDNAATLQKAMNWTTANDNTLRRLSIFGYQSYVRAYAAMPRAVKKFFPQQELHLGQVATTFAADATPTEMKRQARAHALQKEERDLGRDYARYKKKDASVHLDIKEKYHSSLTLKAAQKTKDWVVQKRSERDDRFGGQKMGTNAEFEA